MRNSRPWFLSKVLISAAIILLWCGSGSAIAQPSYDPRIEGVGDSPNPKVNGRGKLSARQQAIEDAIEVGNKARDEFDFEKALISYRGVADKLNPKDARAFFGLGNVYADIACTDNAIRAYKEALRLNKDFRDAIIALGNEYAHQERFDEAEAQFRSLLILNPRDVAGSMGLTFVMGKRKRDQQQALSELRLIANKSSITDKERANAHFLIGNLYMEQRKFPEAVTEYSEVVKLKYFQAQAYISLGQTELFSAMSRFRSLVRQEVTIEDQETLVKAAKYAAAHVSTAQSEFNYKHPYADLLLAYALQSQFNFQEAEKTVRIYLANIKELESRLPLATNCDNGIEELYAQGYVALALSYQRQADLETDVGRKDQLHEAVIENADKLLELRSDDPIAYELLGQVYLAKGRYDDAIAEFEKSFIYQPNPLNKASLYELIASCYSRTSRYEDAIATFEKSLKLRPNTPSTLWGLAGVYEQKGDFEKAISLKNEVISVQPNASSYWMLASTYLERARKTNSDADFRQTITLLEKAIAINHAFGPAYFLLGQVYKVFDRGAFVDKAIENFEAAATYTPKDPYVYLQLGDLYYALKRNYDAAIKYLRDAINLDPNLAKAHWELGAVYHDSGDDVDAVKHLLEAVRIDTSYQEAYVGLISIYKTQKKYAEAVQLLHQVLQEAPTASWPYRELAKINELQQQNAAAIRYYQQLIELLDANDVFGKELYGCRIQRLRRSYPEAIRCFQSLKPTSREDPGQQAYEIGLTYVASGNKKAALEQYDQLRKVESALAAELMAQISEMK